MVFLGHNELRLVQNSWHLADDSLKCMSLTKRFEISVKISLKWVLKGLINNKWTSVQVIAFYYQAWPIWQRSMMPYGITRPQWVNTLRPRQNGRHFPDNIFQCIFLNENVQISIKISLKFVAKGPVTIIPTLVQIMALHQPGDKPLSEPMMVFSLLMHICVARTQWVNKTGCFHCCNGNSYKYFGKMET